MTTSLHTDAQFSRLYLVGDNAPWVLSEEVRSVHAVATRLGIETESVTDTATIHNQCIFFISRYAMFQAIEHDHDNRIAFAYFHGTPGTGYPEFDDMFQRLSFWHPRISRVQVSYSAMADLMDRTGMAPEKIHRIPLAIELAYFPHRTMTGRHQARQALGIPQDAFVVGSFQKDGNGWGDGFEPKPIKGPDVFLRVIDAVRDRIPGLMVLLTGPARGFVKRGLEQLRVPHKHISVDHYEDVGQCYNALDAYVVASRQEGGPKAVLESMAAGVPLVTTRVGQAMDLVQHGINGWMSPVEDVPHLAAGLLSVRDDNDAWVTRVMNARATAEANSYDRQSDLWRRFFAGFVNSHTGAGAAWRDVSNTSREGRAFA
jgi:glycosyltransferase involved in cell wall biosynthesis